MFNNFPKSRQPLPPNYQAIYDAYYAVNRHGRSPMTSLVAKMESWMHKKVSEDVRQSKMKRATLEIGAGTLNHLPYEYDTSAYDIVEPYTTLFSESPFKPEIRHIYSDISDIYRTPTYDRIVSIATFEHICNLPLVVAISALLLNNTGQLRAAIPSEGMLLWNLSWRLTTGIEFKINYGLDYTLLRKYEHVNTSTEIETVINFFFNSVKSSVFGLSRQLSFYQFFACSEPNLDHCHEYIRRYNN